MKKLYLSFPISHFDIEERREFAAKRERYLSEEYGCEVVNPLENGLSEDEHWRLHMKRDSKLLLECDTIFMCKDWEYSKGCLSEHETAVTCGIDVIYECNYWHFDPELKL